MKFCSFIVCCIFAGLLFGCAAQQEPVLESTSGLEVPFHPEKYVCVKATDTVVVDGDINDAAWQKALWSNAFVDIEGEQKPLPLWDTKVKMLWDDNYLYVAAELTEPHIWATLTQHDTIIYHDDDFEVFIDPDGDTHNYYEYEINALATDWDLILTKPYRDGGQAVNSWEIPGLLKGVKIYGSLNNPEDKDSCWTVELAFPLQVLREYNAGRKVPKAGDQWRVNFSRVDWTMVVEDKQYLKKTNDQGKTLPESNWVWSPQGVVAMHRPETWGYVQFADHQTDAFVDHADEIVKWALRQLYYRQKAYFAENKRYTSNAASLRLQEIPTGDIVFDPEIKTTDSGFEASVPSIDKDGRWLIQTDGLLRFVKK